MADNISNWIAAASGVVSVLSLATSFWFAGKTLAIGREQEFRKRPKLNVLIRDEWMRKSDKSIQIALSLRITNASESGNYIKMIYLHVNYSETNGRQVPLVLEHERDQSKFFAQSEDDPLQVDKKIDAYEVCSGLVYFSIPRSLYDEVHVKSYILKITDMTDINHILPILHLKELSS